MVLHVLKSKFWPLYPNHILFKCKVKCLNQRLLRSLFSFKYAVKESRYLLNSGLDELNYIYEVSLQTMFWDLMTLLFSFTNVSINH